MKTFKVFVSFDGQGFYTVKANTKEEAEKSISKGQFEEYEDLQDTFTNEEVIEIEEI